MRVAIISDHASPLAELAGAPAGRLQQHVAHLSAAVAALGHEVRVYAGQNGDRPPRRVTADPGVTVVPLPADPSGLAGPGELLPGIRRTGDWLAASWRDGDWTPDVVHAHFWIGGLTALVAQATVPRPIVQTFHALGAVQRRHQREPDPSPANRVVLEQAVGRQVDRVIAQSSEEISELLLLGVPRQRITLAPSGVDTSAFAPTGPIAPRRPDLPRILAVGRLVERNGFADLIHALPRIPGAEAVVVGGPSRAGLPDDPAARRLHQVATVAGVADRVRLVGEVPPDELPRWYRSAEILVCAPWYARSGRTALEGMACGNPVIATAVGGLTDLVVDGVTGDLVPPRDPHAIGDAVRRLLADSVRRLGYATAAVDRARQRYPWSRTAEQIAAVYQAVAGPRRTGAPAGAATRG